MRRWRTIGLALLGYLPVFAGAARAQEGTISGYVIDVTDDSGRGQPGVPVILSTGAGETHLGTTGSDGSLAGTYTDALPARTPITLSSGFRFDMPVVWVHRSDELPPDCQDAQRTATEDDDCVELIGAIWRVTDRLSVRIPRTTSATPPIQVPGTGFGKGDFSVALTVDYGWYRHFGNVVGAQPDITSSSSDSFRPGLGLAFEYQIASSWKFGVGAHYNTHAYEQAFSSSDPLIPTDVTGEVDAFAFNFYTAPVIDLGPVRTSIPFGYSLMWNRSRILSAFLFGEDGDTDRSLTGGKAFFGLHADAPIGRDWFFRGGIEYTSSFDGEDADENGRFLVGVVATF